MNPATPQKNASHPDLDRLLAYHAGELTEDETSRLQDHLVHCRECSDLVLEAAVFEAPETYVSGVSDIERRTAWRALRKSLPRGARVPLLTALAALLVLGLGLSIWMLQTRSVAPEAGVQALGPIYDAYSESRVRSEARGPEPLGFPPGVEQATVILNPRSTPTYPRYAAEVELPGGAVLTVDDLYRSPSGGFHVGLSRGALTEGTVSVRLFGVDDAGRKTEIDRFEVPVYFER